MGRYRTAAVVLLLLPALYACEEQNNAQEENTAQYSREEWGDWSHMGACNTRIAVLERDGKNVRLNGCKIIAGEWVSSYDNKTITDAKLIDIDHIVPLKEASQSGANVWTKQERNKFYNDLDNLIAVSQSSNRSKGDKDPAEYLPQFNQCDYLEKYVSVKVRYNLSMNESEQRAINGVKC